MSVLFISFLLTRLRAPLCECIVDFIPVDRAQGPFLLSFSLSRVSVLLSAHLRQAVSGCFISMGSVLLSVYFRQAVSGCSLK